MVISQTIHFPVIGDVGQRSGQHFILGAVIQVIVKREDLARLNKRLGKPAGPCIDNIRGGIGGNCRFDFNFIRVVFGGAGVDLDIRMIRVPFFYSVCHGMLGVVCIVVPEG